MPAIAAAPLFYGALAGAGATVATGIYASHKQGEASKNATQASIEAQNRAAELEAKSAADALEFAKAQEAQRRAEWEQTQARNYDIYLTQRKDLEPYRRLGAGTIGQMARPIPGLTPQPGTLGALGGR